MPPSPVATNSKIVVVETLLKAGARTDVSDGLIEAAAGRGFDAFATVKLLLDAGARFDVSDKAGLERSF